MNIVTSMSRFVAQDLFVRALWTSKALTTCSQIEPVQLVFSGLQETVWVIPGWAAITRQAKEGC